MNVRTRLEKLESRQPRNPYAHETDEQLEARIRYLIGRRLNRDITDMPDDEFQQLCDQTYRELQNELAQKPR